MESVKKSLELNSKNEMESDEKSLDLNSNELDNWSSQDQQKQKNRPGTWYPLPYEPRYFDYHPCIHRWMREHSPVLLPENRRYIIQPLSERVDALSQPLVRYEYLLMSRYDL